MVASPLTATVVVLVIPDCPTMFSASPNTLLKYGNPYGLLCVEYDTALTPPEVGIIQVSGTRTLTVVLVEKATELISAYSRSPFATALANGESVAVAAAPPLAVRLLALVVLRSLRNCLN